MILSSYWKKCSVCKKEIGFQSIYQKCSISTCRKQAFCNVDCWSVHDSVMGHKSAYAEEERAPSEADAQNEKPRRRLVTSPSSANPSASSSSSDLPMDTLIVISKLKSYVKAKSSMNTSADVADELSQYVRVLVNLALDQAQSEGRKTLMARDFKNITVN